MKWPKVIHLKQATTATTVNALRSIFARFGLNEIMVMDNGAQFISDPFATFCKINGIKHVRVAP